MIARAEAIPRAAPSSPGMVGNKRPQPHRLHLTNGRVLEGDLHRAPNIRLADHLSTIKGFLSVTRVTDASSGDSFSHLVINLEQVLFVEEMEAPVVPNGARLSVS